MRENDTFAFAFVNLGFSSDLKREDLLFCYSLHATAACGPFEYDGNHFKNNFSFCTGLYPPSNYCNGVIATWCVWHFVHIPFTLL